MRRVIHWEDYDAWTYDYVGVIRSAILSLVDELDTLLVNHAAETDRAGPREDRVPSGGRTSGASP